MIGAAAAPVGPDDFAESGATVVPVGEAQAVMAYVTGRLLRLGFTSRQASTLAANRVNWHDAERLVAAGCLPDMAFLILR